MKRASTRFLSYLRVVIQQWTINQILPSFWVWFPSYPFDVCDSWNICLLNHFAVNHKKHQIRKCGYAFIFLDFGQAIARTGRTCDRPTYSLVNMQTYIFLIMVHWTLLTLYACTLVEYGIHIESMSLILPWRFVDESHKYTEFVVYGKTIGLMENFGQFLQIIVTLFIRPVFTFTHFI